MKKESIKRMKDLMESKNLTQAGLADIVGVRQQSIQKILSNEIGKPRHLPEIARALDVSIEFLLYGDEIITRSIEHKTQPDIQAIVNMLEDMPESRVKAVRESIQNEKQELDQLYSEMQKRKA